MTTTHHQPAPPCAQAPTDRRHRVGTALLAVGAVSLVGAGAFASWQATTTATTGTVSAAMESVSVIDANGSTFTSTMPDLLPADYWYRYVDLRNDGTDVASFTGLVTATGDLSGALTAQIDRCSISWTGGGQCLGAVTSVLANTSVDENGVPVDYRTIARGELGAAHIRYRFMLKDTAPQTLMGKTGTLAISVTGIVTGGADRTNG